MPDMMAQHPSSVALAIPSWLRERLAALDDSARSGDEEQMRLVLDVAEENSRKGGGPFAAAIFTGDGRLVAVGVNRVVPDSAPIAHAEIVAIAAAGQRLGTWNLRAVGHLALVSSTEPCAMCMGAVPWSGVRALVIGARDADARSAGFDEGNKPDDWLEHLASLGVDVRVDVLRASAAAILAEYAASGGPIYNG